MSNFEAVQYQHHARRDAIELGFAGITNSRSVRKVKEGETNNHIFAFLTTEPNAEVDAVHHNVIALCLLEA